jgi:Flp pilus assembly protein TadG
MMKQRRGRQGSTVTEFAMLVPLVVLVLISVLEGGRMFSLWLSMEQAVRESARAGAVAVGDPAREPTLAATVEDLAVDRLSTLGLDPDNLTVTVTVGAPPEGVVDVQADYVLASASPFISAMLGEGFTLRAHSAMRVE